MFDRQSRLSNRRPPLIAALLLTSVFAGCMGTRGRAEDAMDPGARETEEIELLVRNNNFSQATVYTSREYGSKRLGIVKGKSDATFKFEWHLPDIQLRVRFLAGSGFLTEKMPVSPDDLLELELLSGTP